VNVSDDVPIFFKPPHHIAVHQLHVVDVEKQFDTGGTNASDNVRDIVDVVPW
jgi:hypothetical protein